MSEKQVPISIELYEKLSDVAAKRNVTPSQLANKLLEEEMNRKYYKFFNGRKWTIPRSTFIVFALPHEEWQKLKEWKNKGHHITVDCMRDNEVLILNQTKLDEGE